MARKRQTQQMVRIDALIHLEEGVGTTWAAELAEKDYDTLLGLLDTYGTHLVIAAAAQIGEDQEWIPERTAKEIGERAASDLQDQWQAEYERALW